MVSTTNIIYFLHDIGFYNIRNTPYNTHYTDTNEKLFSLKKKRTSMRCDCHVYYIESKINIL